MNKKRKHKMKVLAALSVMLIGLISVGYPFWSYMISDHVAQRELDRLQTHLDGLTFPEKEEIKKQARENQERSDKKGGSIVDPFDLEKFRTADPTGADRDTPFGYLVIPKLDVKNFLYLGADEQHLMEGVAQVEGTDLPIGGKSTRSVIAGHRGTHRVSMMFRWLDKLAPGDKIYLYTPEGKLTYAVTDQEIILPSQNEKLLPVPGKDMITLLTCDPFPYNTHRLLVNAERVEEKKESEIQTTSIKEDIREYEQNVPTDSAVRQAKLRNRAMVVLTGALSVLTVVLMIREILRPADRKKRSENSRAE